MAVPTCREPASSTIDSNMQLQTTFCSNTHVCVIKIINAEINAIKKINSLTAIVALNLAWVATGLN